MVTNLTEKRGNFLNCAALPMSSIMTTPPRTPQTIFILLFDAANIGTALRNLNGPGPAAAIATATAAATTIGIGFEYEFDSGPLWPRATNTIDAAHVPVFYFDSIGAALRELTDVGYVCVAALTAPATITTIVIDNENKLEYDSGPNGSHTQTQTSHPTVPGIDTAFNFVPKQYGVWY